MAGSAEVSKNANERWWAKLRIVWLSTSVTHVLLGAVLWYMRFSPWASPAPGAPPPEQFLPLAAVNGALLLATALLPYVLFRRDPNVRALQGVQRLTDEQLSAIKNRASEALGGAWLLGEPASMVAFGIGMLGYSPAHFLPFFALSWALQAARYPTPSLLARMLLGGIF